MSHIISHQVAEPEETFCIDELVPVSEWLKATQCSHDKHFSH